MNNAGRQQKTFAGKYTVERLIGTGGMGVVYAAVDRRTGERVAIKVLREEDLNDDELKRRFAQEARAAADLAHPNVVRLFQVDEDREHGIYMVMELLTGETLHERLAHVTRIPLEPLCETLFPIMHAVSAAHDRGILHRDLKPANIFIHRTREGRVVPKLLDFGIARVIQAKSAMLTRTGQILGTPDHMSPEQAYGEKQLGPTTDVWSMAVVFYRALAGVGPFLRKNVEATMLDVASATYPPLDVVSPDLPNVRALQAAIGRALTREVEHRTPTMRALMEEVARVASIEPSTILDRFELAWPDDPRGPMYKPVSAPKPAPVSKISRAGAEERVDNTLAGLPTAVTREPPRAHAPARSETADVSESDNAVATQLITQRSDGSAVVAEARTPRWLVVLLLVAAVLAGWGAIELLKDPEGPQPMHQVMP